MHLPISVDALNTIAPGLYQEAVSAMEPYKETLDDLLQVIWLGSYVEGGLLRLYSPETMFGTEDPR